MATLHLPSFTARIASFARMRMYSHSADFRSTRDFQLLRRDDRVTHSTEKIHCRTISERAAKSPFLRKQSAANLPRYEARGEFIYGSDPCIAALRAGRRAVYRLYCSDVDELKE